MRFSRKQNTSRLEFMLQFRVDFLGQLAMSGEPFEPVFLYPSMSVLIFQQNSVLSHSAKNLDGAGCCTKPGEPLEI